MHTGRWSRASGERPERAGFEVGFDCDRNFVVGFNVYSAMVKVDFAKVPIENIEGVVIEMSFRQQIGNQLYMTGRNIEECELGKRIYFAEGDVELTDKEAAIVTQAIAGYSYVARIAIENAMKGGQP
jgi:hypothetical protein